MEDGAALSAQSFSLFSLQQVATPREKKLRFPLFPLEHNSDLEYAAADRSAVVA